MLPHSDPSDIGFSASISCIWAGIEGPVIAHVGATCSLSVDLFDISNQRYDEKASYEVSER
jgi:hypothetical protein